jgi:hypothetical protein
VLGDSVDRFGRERFHPLAIDHYFDTSSFPNWMQTYSGNRTAHMCFQAISDTSISFHFMQDDKMQLIDRLWRAYKASTDRSKSFNESVIVRFLEENRRHNHQSQDNKAI